MAAAPTAAAATVAADAAAAAAELPPPPPLPRSPPPSSTAAATTTMTTTISAPLPIDERAAARDAFGARLTALHRRGKTAARSMLARTRRLIVDGALPLSVTTTSAAAATSSSAAAAVGEATFRSADEFPIHGYRFVTTPKVEVCSPTFARSLAFLVFDFRRHCFLLFFLCGSCTFFLFKIPVISSIVYA